MILKINTNLLLGILVLAVIIGLATLAFIILFGNPFFKPKDNDIPLDWVVIKEIEVKSAKIQKATETHNIYGKIEDNE